MLWATAAGALAQTVAETKPGAQGCIDYGPMMHSGFMGSMWHGGWMQGCLHGLLAWLVLTLIALATLWAFLSGRRGSCRCQGAGDRPPVVGDRNLPDTTHRALQILNERYAKGEVDKAEFEERRTTLLAELSRRV